MQKAPAKPAVAAYSPQVQVFTSMGNFTIELNPERAPLTVANYFGLCRFRPLHQHPDSPRSR